MTASWQDFFMEVVGDTFRSARQYRHRDGIALPWAFMTAGAQVEVP